MAGKLRQLGSEKEKKIKMRAFKTIQLVLLVCIFHKTFGHNYGNVEQSPVVETKLSSRTKRTLWFPPPSQSMLLIVGIGTPLQLERENVIVGVFAKFLYFLPSNSTYFTSPGIYFQRGGKSRWSIYKVLEKAAGLYGFGGKACLLRAICEIAAAPFDLNHGIIGQLVQTLLTPSSTVEPYEEYADREYHAAESLGRHVGENCHALYPECQKSALDVFSTTGL